ncbi:hypothetical protein [Paenibacillus massiliensis]|uniref:hypothetical protein n=1 Tax=Paenibacillus massiliensis TaxID=225917 RepID=UPI00041EBB5B|nr:hypothetical protein [Paenibacillus massiliensis]
MTTTYYVKGIRLVALALLVYVLWGTPVDAAPTSEETRRILEDSLSIVEMDHEIGRISSEQEQLIQQQSRLSVQLAAQQEQIQLQQERASQVVRAYYMGDRDQLLQALLEAENLHQLLTLYDYYDLIMSRDQEVLAAYQSDYQALRRTEQNTARTVAELANVKSRLLEQRERLSRLKDQVSAQIANSSDPENIRLLAEEMTAYWENIGLYEVKRHFRALASAMQDLPAFIQSQPGAISTNGRTYHITLQEQAFNQFLKSKSSLFQQFGFTFGQHQITVQGKSGSMDLLIAGYYSVENNTQNAIVFHVERLVFNGLELPESTRKALGEEFDLGFYPQQLISYVKATDVRIIPGTMEVTLELSL